MRVGVAAAGVLAALHGACFPPAERWDEAAMRALLSTPGCLGWLQLLDDGSPCGLGLARVAADEAELLTIGVCPDRRGDGHGGRIVAGLCALAAAHGAERMILEVACGNAAALSLYRRSGFADIGLRRRYYPDGADAMVLAAPLPLPEHRTISNG